MNPFLHNPRIAKIWSTLSYHISLLQDKINRAPCRINWINYGMMHFGRSMMNKNFIVHDARGLWMKQGMSFELHSLFETYIMLVEVAYVYATPVRFPYSTLETPLDSPMQLLLYYQRIKGMKTYRRRHHIQKLLTIIVCWIQGSSRTCVQQIQHQTYMWSHTLYNMETIQNSYVFVIYLSWKFVDSRWKSFTLSCPQKNAYNIFSIYILMKWSAQPYIRQLQMTVIIASEQNDNLSY